MLIHLLTQPNSGAVNLQGLPVFSLRLHRIFSVCSGFLTLPKHMYVILIGDFNLSLGLCVCMGS